MTEILAILGGAALFVVFGLMTRGRSRRGPGRGCSCPTMPEGCNGGFTCPEGAEREHADR